MLAGSILSLFWVTVWMVGAIAAGAFVAGVSHGSR